MLYENREHQWVYSFEQGNASMKALLGGKGANVAEMTDIGLPVPPGFTITTEACTAYQDYSRQFPEGMWSQVQEALRAVEESTGKCFGSAENPLLVSVRSGAAVSMPGMMDTVLNLGLNDETVEGLAALTGNPRFAYDAYRRFITMFASVVMDVKIEKFDRVLNRYKAQTTSGADTDLSVEQLQEIVATYKTVIFSERHGDSFPQDPLTQLRMAISAVFESWNNERAIAYRRVHRIADDIGTAVNVQSMVFGNMGWDCGTGVAFTRNPSTGEAVMYGEFLLNAQGEDVVAGIRTPKPIAELAKDMPTAFAQFQQITKQLESHYQDMQDIEFTIEKGKLYLLQTRTGKRTGAAAVRVAVEMVEEGMIDQRTALMRVDGGQIDQLLHPMIDPSAEIDLLTQGLPASPGAATGRLCFTPAEAEKYSEKGRVILVRHETSPDDFNGMLVSEAVLTARGGMTSHAAVVARGMGKPCVVGAEALEIDEEEGYLHVSGVELRRGDWLTIDGSTGRVIRGKVPTVQPELDAHFQTLMSWADEARTLQVRANADNGRDAAVARGYGAEGIGLCRTEHMFFEKERLASMREMILAGTRAEREEALDRLLPIQKNDFKAIFRAMDGLPVTIRLLDPPLHEFLPDATALHVELVELKLKLQKVKTYKKLDATLKQIYEKEQLMAQVERLHESNPMLGHRGCRLGMVYPEVTMMQARAIIAAACEVQVEGIVVTPEIMIPLVSMATELQTQRAVVKEVADRVIGEYGLQLDYHIGTMIELPRAAMTADEIAEHADFFSFGTNDLTQTTFGLSRDDSARFLSHYITHKVMPSDPFRVLDQGGVGKIVQTGVEKGRQTKPKLKVGICGEHGGEPSSIDFCHRIGMNYVSCSPFRVPIARLAAAQSALRDTL